jgi:hypothetical protein
MRSREYIWIKYKVPLWFYKEARQRYKNEKLLIGGSYIDRN